MTAANFFEMKIYDLFKAIEMFSLEKRSLVEKFPCVMFCRSSSTVKKERKTELISFF